jgi:hypothetical protein
VDIPASPRISLSSHGSGDTCKLSNVVILLVRSFACPREAQAMYAHDLTCVLEYIFTFVLSVRQHGLKELKAKFKEDQARTC